MYKACSKCGKIHDTNYKCKAGRVYAKNTNTDKLRQKNKWKVKSKEIRERANYLCEVCRDRGIYTYDNLDVHHINKLADDPKGLLDNLNLITLCREHHKQADEGKIDKEYLLELAKKREEAIK